MWKLKLLTSNFFSISTINGILSNILFPFASAAKLRTIACSTAPYADHPLTFLAFPVCLVWQLLLGPLRWYNFVPSKCSEILIEMLEFREYKSQRTQPWIPSANPDWKEPQNLHDAAERRCSFAAKSIRTAWQTQLRRRPNARSPCIIWCW